MVVRNEWLWNGYDIKFAITIQQIFRGVKKNNFWDERWTHVYSSATFLPSVFFLILNKDWWRREKKKKEKDEEKEKVVVVVVHDVSLMIIFSSQPSHKGGE